MKQFMHDFKPYARYSDHGDYAPRRLHMPERLELRNAPGVLLAFLPTFDAPVGQVAAVELSDDPTVFRSEIRDLQGLPWAIAADEAFHDAFNFGDVLSTTEIANDSSSALEIARQTTEFLTPVQLAVRSQAFESLFTDPATFMLIPDSLPPVIKPVEPPEEPGEAVKMPVPDTPQVVPPVVVDAPASADGRSDDVPVDPPQSTEAPPPLIQPVIKDPNSEHNQQ